MALENKLTRREFIGSLATSLAFAIGGYSCKQSPVKEEEGQETEGYEIINGIQVDKKVTKDLYQLHLDYTPVIVTLKDTTNIPDSAPDEDYFRRAEIYRKDQDEILKLLTEEEFKLKYTYTIINGFAGQLSKTGLDKLIEHDKNILKITGSRIVHAN